MLLKISRDTMAIPVLLRGESDDRDCPGILDQVTKLSIGFQTWQ
jgi:hypothetical protein